MADAVQLIGLKEANAALRRLPAIVQIDVQAVEDVTAFRVASDASAKAPHSVDGSRGHPPGFMAKSIRWESRPRSLAAVVGVAAAAFYWKFIEYGTRKMSAKPFFRPSADHNRDDHHRRMIDALSRAAGTIARLAK